jgi:hypothetical protein
MDMLNTHSIIALGAAAYRYAVLLRPSLLKKAVQVQFDPDIHLSDDDKLKILSKEPRIFQYMMDDEFNTETRRISAMQLTIKAMSINPAVYQYTFAIYKNDPMIVDRIPEFLKYSSNILRFVPENQVTLEMELIVVEKDIPGMPLKNIESMIRLAGIHLDYNIPTKTFNKIEFACRAGIQSDNQKLKSLFVAKGFSWNKGMKIRQCNKRQRISEYLF